jgi:hypothetical protein
MIEEIKQIIADNSEEKHFLEYGKGVFITEDAIDEIAESVVKFNVSQQRELLIDFYVTNRNISREDTFSVNVVHEIVDNYLKDN